VPQGWFYVQKFGEGSWVEARILAFIVSCRSGCARATAGRLGTGQTCTHDAGGQCADAIETGVGADGPTSILHSTHGYEKRGPWEGEKRNVVANVMVENIVVFCSKFLTLCNSENFLKIG